ncbi:MAG: uroporphyrinogen-III synthase [Psychromonas sp.]|nr:uroporphyrinogen-III synthase [Alteromonadales bacterium]MCP5077608.1 uroporphyrinogen-III synthase [Psychromonas sp.]
MAKPRLLITRFAPHAQRVAELLNEQGIFCHAQPLLEVKVNQNCNSPFLKHYDFIIAISCNAVEYTSQSIVADWPETRYLAVGKATGSLLHTKTKQPISIPSKCYNSEGLLLLPELQKLHNCSILILRGVGGREFLKEQLIARGATVDYYESYQRVAISLAKSKSIDKWQQQAINGAIISSIELLEQLVVLAGADDSEWLKSLTIYAASQRILNHAVALGFQNNVLLANISHQAIVEYFTGEGSYERD